MHGATEDRLGHVPGRGTVLWRVSVLIALDGAVMTVLAPLLPQLADRFALSKAASGALTACYPLGALLGAIPGFLFASRRGPRAGLLAGAGIFALSSVAFAAASAVPTLFAARLAQGLGCTTTWTSGLAWAIAAAPPRRRGYHVAIVESASVAGTLLGPALGAAASVTGRAPVFIAIAAISGALAGLLLAVPPGAAEVDRPDRKRGIGELGRMAKTGGAAAAALLLSVTAMLSGIVSVLAPLKLASLGVASTVIGAAFLLGAAIEAALNPLVGSWADRDRRRQALIVPLLFGALSLALLAFAEHRVAAVLITCLAVGAVGLGWAPEMALMGALAERNGIDFIAATALIGLAWPPAMLLGTAGGGALAGALGDLTVLLGAAATALAAALFAARAGGLEARLSRPLPRTSGPPETD